MDVLHFISYPTPMSWDGKTGKINHIPETNESGAPKIVKSYTIDLLDDLNLPVLFKKDAKEKEDLKNIFDEWIWSNPKFQELHIPKKNLKTIETVWLEFSENISRHGSFPKDVPAKLLIQRDHDALVMSASNAFSEPFVQGDAQHQQRMETGKKIMNTIEEIENMTYPELKEFFQKKLDNSTIDENAWGAGLGIVKMGRTILCKRHALDPMMTLKRADAFQVYFQRIDFDTSWIKFVVRVPVIEKIETEYSAS